MEEIVKIIKIIGIILLVLIGLFLLLGLIAPKTYRVERSASIDAPQELVFRHVRYWNSWQGWSPWAERDSSMQVTVEGVDGQEGALYKWVGNPKITGTGEMANTGVTDNQRIDYHMRFLEPYPSESDGHITVDKVGVDSSRVTWVMEGSYGFAERVFMLFMNMDKMLGADFERGFTLLKEKAEAEQAAIEQLSTTIKKVNFPARTFAAVQKTVSFSQMQPFFAESFAKIMEAVNKNRVRVVGAPCGLYFSWDEGTGNSDMAAAIPVNRSFKAEGIQMITLPRQTAYTVDYYGPYEGSGIAYLALDAHLKKLGLAFKEPVIDEYITDPNAEPDPAKWLTRITYFAQ